MIKSLPVVLGGDKMRGNQGMSETQDKVEWWEMSLRAEVTY